MINVMNKIKVIEFWALSLSGVYWFIICIGIIIKKNKFNNPPKIPKYAKLSRRNECSPAKETLPENIKPAKGNDSIISKLIANLSNLLPIESSTLPVLSKI